MCKGMKVSMCKSFSLLYHSPYSGLFHQSERLDPPNLTDLDKYPLIDYLRNKFDELFRQNLVTVGEKENYADAINLFEIMFYRTIETNSSLPIYRWIFVINFEIYDYVKIDKNFFEIKLLYTYACLSSICHFRLNNKSNIWIDFIEWNKSYNFFIFDKWNDYYDEEFYQLVIEK